MTIVSVWLVMGWVAGFVLAAAGLRAGRPVVTVAGLAVFAGSVAAWLGIVNSQA